MAKPSKRDKWLTQDDAALLGDCRVDTHRSSGPGGQHANKTSSAVRLRHRPTGQTVVAEEQRSQHANKCQAIKRLRLAIALNVRQPAGAPGHRPEILGQFVSKNGRVEISLRNQAYPMVVAAVLDAIAACTGRMREAGAMLGLSTGQLSRFLVRDGKLLEAANRIRRAAGLRALTPSH